MVALLFPCQAHSNTKRFVMRRCTVLAQLVVSLSVGFSGVTLARAASSPRAVFLETTHQFGTVKQGEKAVHAFTVRNDGDAPLSVNKVDLTMPGMTVRATPTIAAGTEGKITLELNTNKVTGEFEGQAIVHLDDPAQATVTLSLTGIIKSSIEVQPQRAIFLSVFKGETAERSLTITNNEERPLYISQVENGSQHFSAALKTVEEGKVYQLTVKVPADAADGRYEEAVILHTDHPRHSRVRIPVNVLIKNDLYASPETIDFGQISLQQLMKEPKLLPLLTQTFLVKKRQGEFAITSISTDVAALQLTKSPDSQSGAFRVDVQLAKEHLRQGSLKGSIVVETTDPQFPKLTVPVTGNISGP